MRGTLVKSSLIAGLGLATLAPAHAADFPGRKSGLWEANVKSAMGPSMTMQSCVDGSADKPGAMVAAQNRAQCEAASVNPVAGGYHFHMVCHPNGNMTMTSDGTATGDFKTAYTVSSTMTMTPSPQGMPPMSSTISARYLGACPADMQPGDVKMNGRVMHPGAGR
jgi:hypothetical protein